MFLILQLFNCYFAGIVKVLDFESWIINIPVNCGLFLSAWFTLTHAVPERSMRCGSDFV